MSTEETRTNPLLERVADALGLPVERLFDDAASDDPGETVECLRLWHRLTSAKQRQQALGALRGIADGSEPPR